jgi:hypothetical protein
MMNIPWLRQLREIETDHTAPVWSPRTYPDEEGYRARIEGMIERIARQGFNRRTKSRSYCPDTRALVLTDALKGEMIASPYTGKLYPQGNTGYFGPRERDERGRITRFGGDPLKYDLPPAMAALLLNPKDREAHWYLGQPGSMRQQYHFAAKNWARFYPVLAHIMGEEWRREFIELVGAYQETRKPSDGARQHDRWVGAPHNLVGEPDALLGGNIQNGGTENHKVMWRTSCLVYAQHFPDEATISGYPVPEARKQVTTMIGEFVRRLLLTGNGEYDSCTYYPHSIEGFLNLYDFSHDRQIQDLAQIALDYYLATAGLKVIDGTLAGAQKRGYLSRTSPSELESILWAWTDDTSKPMNDAVVPIHQITSHYRPNRIIRNIIRKKLPMPFECFMRRPAYHMDSDNCFQETLFCSRSFGLGSTAMTLVDNPTQQVVWSLIARGTEGPLCFGGGQPQFLTPYGHSPYSQTIQKRSALMLVTGQTAPRPAGESNVEQDHRYHVAQRRLDVLEVPTASASEEERRAFFNGAAKSAASWLFIPKNLPIVQDGARAFIQANDTFVAAHSLTGGFDLLVPRLLDPDPEGEHNRGHYRFFEQYVVLVSSGAYSGFVLDVGEKSDYGTLEAFTKAIDTNTRLSTTDFAHHGKAAYRSLPGDTIELSYNPTGLRARGAINGEPIDYDTWAGGAVYQSPFVRIKDGIMTITDGNEGYRVDFRGKRPVIETL